MPFSVPKLIPHPPFFLSVILMPHTSYFEIDPLPRLAVFFFAIYIHAASFPHSPHPLHFPPLSLAVVVFTKFLIGMRTGITPIYIAVSPKFSLFSLGVALTGSLQERADFQPLLTQLSNIWAVLYFPRASFDGPFAPLGFSQHLLSKSCASSTSVLKFSLRLVGGLSLF